MLLLIYLLYQILATSQTVLTASIEPLLSAAKGNRTTLHTEISPPWVSSSNTRGTSDILWSCIVTLTACVYSALHLNIPPANEGKLKFYWRKLKWVAIALFAPEIVLYCALTQFLGKCLVCMQVVWFVIQCVARAAAKYPLILVEIHTIVHVVCALSMYILWWKVSLIYSGKKLCLGLSF